MLALTPEELLSLRILGCGDEPPARFNARLIKQAGQILSFETFCKFKFSAPDLPLHQDFL